MTNLFLIAVLVYANYVLLRAFIKECRGIAESHEARR
jgi:hypothetical protein